VTQFTAARLRYAGVRRWWLCGALALVWGAAAADDQPPAPEEPLATPGRQTLEDAWWTGPLLAPNASTFPRGHALIEPYVFDVITTGRYDSDGNHRPAPAEHDLGSLTYLIYAISDRVAVGLLPRFGYNEPAGEPSSSSPQAGDFGAQVQYGLTSFHEGSWVPATAVVLGETFPTGRYDRLSRASDGLGAGVYTTSLAWYSQDYLWLPNGRLLRVRLDLTYTVSGGASVEDASVYGTTAGFRGHAYPGDGATVDTAAEYSVTRNWVLAADLIYQHDGSTRVTGSEPATAGAPGFVNLESGASDYLAVAPAVEFNWSARAGVIVGARIFVAGRNTTASVTPVAAVNLVY
jgi:hypothetical protein